MILEIFLLLLTYAVYWLYKIHRKQKTYWKELDVKTPPISFPLGNNPGLCKEILTGEMNMLDVAQKQYHLLKGEKYYGTYTLGTPSLVNIFLQEQLKFRGPKNFLFILLLFFIGLFVFS